MQKLLSPTVNLSRAWLGIQSSFGFLNDKNICENSYHHFRSLSAIFDFRQKIMSNGSSNMSHSLLHCVKSYVKVQPHDNWTVGKSTVFGNSLRMKLSVTVANRKYFYLTLKVAVAHCRHRPSVYSFNISLFWIAVSHHFRFLSTVLIFGRRRSRLLSLDVMCMRLTCTQFRLWNCN